MKIKKKNTTIPINGKIVDTENVEDKTSNAPSLRLVEKMIKDTYSTEEQRIGTWVDGKPLYRKVISSKLPKVTTEGSYVTKTIPIGVDIDFGFTEKAFYTDVYNGRISLPWITGNGSVIRGYLDVPGQQISLSSSATDTNEQPVTIIVCYTKATD